jgi:hypothetical protein
MRVAEIQIQLKRGGKTAEEMIHAIDSSAPVPSPLEGGNMEGPLYLCILKEDILRFLKYFKKENEDDFIVYSGPHFFDLKDECYSPAWTCQWSMDGYATVTKTVKNDHTLS